MTARRPSQTTRRGPAAPVSDALEWTTVSWTHPCRVCGGRGGCRTAAFHGGFAVDCRNVVSAWPMTDGGWLHRRPAVGAADDPRHRAEGAACDFPVPSRCGALTPTAAGADGTTAAAPGASTTETVLGAFATPRMAEQAVDALLAAGFGAGELSVLGRHDEAVAPTPRRGTTENRAARAAIGAAVGGFGAAAVGLVGAAVPGVGPVVAFGPFSTALSAALGTGFGGGLIGFFAAHGVPDPDAARYAERVRAGVYVVAVHTAEGPRAESVLALSGAEAPIRHAPD